MKEFEALRREIEVRLARETAYRVALSQVEENTMKGTMLQSALIENDEVIRWIGEYLLKAHKSKWEKFYAKKLGEKK